jgi:hypothetical protein
MRVCMTEYSLRQRKRARMGTGNLASRRVAKFRTFPRMKLLWLIWLPARLACGSNQAALNAQTQ